MKIHIETIPSKGQRYPTCADYYMLPSGVIEVKVNEMGDERAEIMVVLHELIEAFLCRYALIDWTDIDKFDMKFSKKNKSDEPGDKKNAPYHKEHMIATKVEKMLCKEFGLTWKQYNKIIYES